MSYTLRLYVSKNGLCTNIILEVETRESWLPPGGRTDISEKMLLNQAYQHGAICVVNAEGATQISDKKISHFCCDSPTATLLGQNATLQRYDKRYRLLQDTATS